VYDTLILEKGLKKKRGLGGGSSCQVIASRGALVNEVIQTLVVLIWAHKGARLERN